MSGWQPAAVEPLARRSPSNQDHETARRRLDKASHGLRRCDEEAFAAQLLQEILTRHRTAYNGATRWSWRSS